MVKSIVCNVRRVWPSFQCQSGIHDTQGLVHSTFVFSKCHGHAFGQPACSFPGVHELHPQVNRGSESWERETCFKGSSLVFSRFCVIHICLVCIAQTIKPRYQIQDVRGRWWIHRYHFHHCERTGCRDCHELYWRFGMSQISLNNDSSQLKVFVVLLQRPWRSTTIVRLPRLLSLQEVLRILLRRARRKKLRRSVLASLFYRRIIVNYNSFRPLKSVLRWDSSKSRKFQELPSVLAFRSIWFKADHPSHPPQENRLSE